MTTTKTKRTPRTNEIQDLGPEAVGVVLQAGDVAILDRWVWRRLEQSGQTGRMFLNRNRKGGEAYVRMEGPDNLVTVARLVVQAGPDDAVRHINRNRLDLRAANLEKVPRRGIRKSPQQTARDLFPKDHDAQAKWLQLQDGRRKAAKEVQPMLEVIRAQGRPVRAGAVGGAEG